MEYKMLKAVNDLIEHSNKISRAIAFCEGKGGMGKRHLKFDANFDPLFNQYVRHEVEEAWMDQCLAVLKAKKLDIDSEIRKTITDW